jgi:Protein of unknown function (DUF3015)
MIYLFLAVILSQPASAFNWRKCSRTFVSGGDGKGIFISTSSFFSSTGDCAMIGKLEHDKKVFVNNNFQLMLSDFAKGRGEYAEAYAKMHGCSLSAQKAFSRIMKEQYDSFLELNSKRELYYSLESSFVVDPLLSSECRVEEYASKT